MGSEPVDSSTLDPQECPNCGKMAGSGHPRDLRIIKELLAIEHFGEVSAAVCDFCYEHPRTGGRAMPDPERARKEGGESEVLSTNDPAETEATTLTEVSNE